MIRRVMIVFLLGACTGSIGDPTNVPPTGPGPERPTVSDDCQRLIPTTPLRRLTSEELANTMDDLLGSETYNNIKAVTLRIPQESVGGGDLEGFQASHVETHVSAMLDIGEALGDSLRDGGFERLGFACMTASPDAACVTDFITSFGLKVHRRPVSDVEAQAYLVTYNAEENEEDAARALMMQFMSHPSFLFHIETEGSEEEDVLTLDPYTVANRLSYRVLRTMPTDDLFALAARDELKTEAQRLAAAEVLLNNPRAKESVWRFFEQWLELDEPISVDNDPAILRGIERDGLDEAMLQELRTFVESLVWDDDADFKALWTDRRVPTQDPRVAQIYGVSEWDGTGPYPQSGPERMGLGLRAALLQGTTLATSPIERGVFILRRYLCDELPSPDLDTVNNRLGELDQIDRSTMRARDIIDTMTGNAPCSTCHKVINPIAFVLEDFDALGRHRNVEEAIQNGEVIGSFPLDPAQVDLEFDFEVVVKANGGADLSQALADSRSLHECFIERVMTHTQGRLITAADACALRQISTAALEGMSIRDLYLQSVLAGIEGRALKAPVTMEEASP